MKVCTIKVKPKQVWESEGFKFLVVRRDGRLELLDMDCGTILTSHDATTWIQNNKMKYKYSL